ncbi:alpha/beta-hydrolase [Hypoxylon trugodes]|uniref:alpha/beta-hydrolase n=1 Tax=Hypoxylon trugodes TaxID=326681 RepID=UPI00219004CD|nr:alpha/beta-hydrolase [Hypoxylon trugodes]KAI1394285.1 alpha/beta-hydrolase [Hypoxylon trugodes]
MSPSSSKPTILLIQGAFQLPEVYRKLTDALGEKGYPTVHPPLPSITDDGDRPLGSKDLNDDTLKIQQELKRLVEVESRTVIVLMHSYGGLVGSSGIPEEFSWSKRKEAGLGPGGVLHLFYFSAFVLPQNASVLSVIGEGDGGEIRPGNRFRVKNAAEGLYSDLSRDEAEYWASKIVDQSYAVQETKMALAAYEYIPSTYLICTNDKALPPEIQEVCAKTAGAKVLKIDSGHSPMLDRTEQLVGIITTTVDQAVDQAV